MNNRIPEITHASTPILANRPTPRQPLKSSRLLQVWASTALAASLLLGPDVHADEPAKALVSANEACSIKTTGKTEYLQAIIDKKIAKGINPEEIDILKKELAGIRENMTDFCTENAKANAQESSIEKDLEMAEETDPRTQKMLEVLDAFVKGKKTIEEINEMIKQIPKP